MLAAATYRMKVRIIACRNLTAADSNGFSDPYVELLTNYDLTKRKTKTIKKTLNPEFDEAFEVAAPAGEFDNFKLLFKVMDWDRIGKNDRIGEAAVSVHDKVLPVREETAFWVKLTGKGAGDGELHIGITPYNFATPIDEHVPLVCAMSEEGSANRSISSPQIRSSADGERTLSFDSSSSSSLNPDVAIPTPPMTRNELHASQSKKELILHGQLFSSDMPAIDASQSALASKAYNPNHALWCVIASNLVYRNAHEIERVVLGVWEWKGSEFFEDEVTDTQGFGMYNDDAIVIVFRGTESTRDWVTNIKFSTTSPFVDRPEIKVHKGFNRACISVFTKVEAFVRKAREAIGRPDLPVFITGHSLGGALANLCFAYFSFVSDIDERLALLAQGKHVKEKQGTPLPIDPEKKAAWTKTEVAAVYTFGQPRVGNWELANALKRENPNSTFFRITNNNDVVPTVPAKEVYVHCGDRMFISQDGVFVVGDKIAKSRRDSMRGESTLLRRKRQGVADHLSSAYLEHVQCHFHACVVRKKSLTGLHDTELPAVVTVEESKIELDSDKISADEVLGLLRQFSVEKVLTATDTP